MNIAPRRVNVTSWIFQYLQKKCEGLSMWNINFPSRLTQLKWDLRKKTGTFYAPEEVFKSRKIIHQEVINNWESYYLCHVKTRKFKMLFLKWQTHWTGFSGQVCPFHALSWRNTPQRKLKWQTDKSPTLSHDVVLVLEILHAKLGRVWRWFGQVLTTLTTKGK